MGNNIVLFSLKRTSKDYIMYYRHYYSLSLTRELVLWSKGRVDNSLLEGPGFDSHVG